MGSSFISRARWFEASSHSLLIVRGGGGAAEESVRRGHASGNVGSPRAGPMYDRTSVWRHSNISCAQTSLSRCTMPFLNHCSGVSGPQDCTPL